VKVRAVAGGDIMISYVHQKCNKRYATASIASVRGTQNTQVYRYGCAVCRWFTDRCTIAPLLRAMHVEP